MDKKIGLAIVYDYPDYGSMLQALATQIVVEGLGYETEAINTTNLKGLIAKRKYKYFAENIFDLSIVKEKSKIIAKKLRLRTNKKFAAEQNMRINAFERFKSSHFKESRPYETWDDMQNSSNEYEAVIVGSDQLWLPSNVAADYYTLNWVDDNTKKISYATSFGVGVVPPKYIDRYEKYLKRIEYLSAREVSGQKIIKDIAQRKAPLVCDPALLLDRNEWDKIATPNRIIDDKYVFCYFMGDNPEQREFVKKLAKSRGLKIVSLLHLDQYIASDENYADITPYDVSPADFINLIKNAEYVCTDSFHGTVFSIIYSKNFFTFKRFNKKASLSTNTRIFSLLDRLSLSNRLFTAEEDASKDWEINNYAEIQKIVSDFRSDSMKYLVDAIKS